MCHSKGSYDRHANVWHDALCIKKTTQCLLSIFLFVGLIPYIFASENVGSPIHFNASALDLDSGDDKASNVDLSAFSASGGQTPGVYNVRIYFNGSFIEKSKVTFSMSDKSKGEPEGLRANIIPAQLFNMGVKKNTFSSLDELPDDTVITDIGKYIPGATAQLNFYQMRLDISVPQIAVNTVDNNYAPPSTWDDGISAFLLNYNLNGSQSHDSYGNDSQSQFLALNSGFNAGGWRYRNDGTYTNDDSEGSHWNNNSNYLQHDIRSLRGRLTLGDADSGNSVFDSIPFRGVQLASDSSMMPGRYSSFAPVVRGIANTHAQVTVRQNNNVIYQTYVAPGPFALEDLYPSGSGGPLEISIREENGQIRTFTQQYATVPNMMREGGVQYEMIAGKYHDGSDYENKVPFSLITGTYGAPHNTTLYSGTIIASGYQSVVLGTGMELGILGAVSLDITHSHASPDDGESASGNAWRLRYSRDLNMLGTNLTASAYRYSTRGYRSFSNFSQRVRDDNEHFSPNARNEVQVTLEQDMGEYGSLSLSSTQDSYWDAGSQRNIYTTYSNTLWGASYSLTYSETLGITHGQEESLSKDKQLALTVQIPLSLLLDRTWMSYGATRDDKSTGIQQNISFGGTAMENNQLSYSAQLGYNNNGNEDTSSNNGAITLDYQGTYGDVSSGYSTNAHTTQWTYGLQGGMLMHQYGVTFGHAFQDGAVLVRAPGATGMAISGQSGISTDWRGYAIVPGYSAYQVNETVLSTKTLANTVSISGPTIKKSIPTKGAIVLADFIVQKGEKILFTLKHLSGKVPFGATAIIKGMKDASVVGDDGEVYFTGAPSNGRVVAQWGKDTSQHCEADFSLPSESKDNSEKALLQIPLECR